MNKNKSNEAYKTIGEVTKELNLVNKENGNLQTHTLRYWESQFKQIKPRILAGKRRYYSNKDIKILHYIKFLLKDRGLTINGVKKILDSKKSLSIDDNANLGVYKSDLKKTKSVKERIKKIAKIIADIKDYK